MKSIRRACLPLVCAIFAPTGCGEAQHPTATISGTVTYAGKPVKDGTVLFRGGPKGDVYLSEIKGGKYSGKAAVGTNSVEFLAFETTPDMEKTGFKGGNILPEKYNRASDLTVEIQPGENTKDWALAK